MKTNLYLKTALFLEKKGTTLTANQKKYNSLIKEAALKQEEIDLDRAYLDDVLEFYTDQISPIYKIRTNVYMKLARGYAALIEKGTLEKGKQDILRKAIGYIYRHLSALGILTLEEIEFFDKWHGKIGPQIIPLDFSDAQGFVSALVSDKFGIKMDLSNVNDSPDGHALFAEKIMEQFGFKHSSHFDDSPVQKPTEIVVLYEHLIEQLHAGINLTEDGRLERDDWIRLADRAYEYNDLDALIRLELRCLVTNSDYLESRDHEKINQYISTLKAEISKLKQTHAELLKLSKYEAIIEFIEPEKDLKLAQAKITKQILPLLDEPKVLTTLNKLLRTKNNYEILMRMAKTMADVE